MRKKAVFIGIISILVAASLCFGLRATTIKTNFTGGEFSPRLDGRVDLSKYYNACAILENFLVHPQGGATRRPGTYFVAEVKDHNRRVRLLPFEFSVEQAYLLEFGHQYIRFYKDHGQIYDCDSYTKLLIHADGEDAATDFEDASPSAHNINVYGYAQKDTERKKFGTASIQLAGPSGSYLSIPDSGDWDYGSTRFTIDFWHYPFAYPDATTPDFGWWHHADESGGSALGLYMTWHYKATDGKCYLRVYMTGMILEAEYDIPNLPPEQRLKWRHIALIRGWGGDEDKWAICVDGQALDTDTYAGAVYTASSPFEIGRCRRTNDAALYWECQDFFDEVRVSKGIARWTANFSPPDRAYPFYGAGGGGSPVEISSPYLESELRQIQYAQSADVLYICHLNHPPRKLSRTSHTSWTLQQIEFQDGPYLEDVEATIAITGTTGVVTLEVQNGSERYLLYDTETGAFTVGDTLTGGDSSATGKILAVDDWGTEGVLTLGSVSAEFQDNETITDEHTGSAKVNGTLGDRYLTYDTETGGPFQVGEMIYSADPFFRNFLRGLQDDGATGKMVLSHSNVEFDPGDTIHGYTSAAAAKVVTYSLAMGPVFASTDVGRLMRLYIGTAWFWGKITEVTDSFNAKMCVKGDDLPGGNATSYRLGSWHGANNYPACVAFYEERLFFAGSNNEPQTIWGSQSGDFENFGPGTEDNEAIIYTIATDQVNAIRWLSPGKVLSAGTVGAEFIIRSSASDEPVTPTNVQVKRETTHGSAYLLPKRVSNVVLFVQRAARKIRELAYVWESDSFQAPDMTILSEHITQGGIVEMDYQQEPDSVLWCARADGQLLGLTYNRPQEVICWHRQITDGEFESVAVIPGSGHDEVWLAAKRTIGGSTKRYIEYLTPSEWNQVIDAVYVDSALTYEGAEVQTISGLGHLEGKTVAIMTNLGVHTPEVVSSGSISLDWGVTKAHIGLPYTSKLKTMRVEAGQAEGTAQGKIKRTHKLTIRVLQSLACKVGPSEDKLDSIPFVKMEDPIQAMVTPFTGDKTVLYRGGYDTAGQVMIVQDQPLPLTVLAIIQHLATHDS